MPQIRSRSPQVEARLGSLPQERQSPWHLGLAVTLVLFGAAMRLVEHPWNFAPMWAIALFAGAHIRDRRLALAIPLAALLLSDTLLQILDPARGFYLGMIFTYLGFSGVVGCGMLTRLARRSTSAYIAAVVVAWLGGSIFFFLVSNFGAWLTFPDYPKTFNGLVQCYVAGLPFYRPQLLGDLIYIPLLFGAFALAERSLPVFAPQAAGK